jgi:type IV pilus assembly protein PilY1
MMRFAVSRSLLAALVAGAAVTSAASAARAQQTDTNPPPPNVLILLDNSGSMERMIDGNLPEQEGNVCNYDPTTGKVIATAAQPKPNRWGALLQALTGTFQNNYSCVTMPRNSGSAFQTEYQINGNKPYDTDYYLPFHRPVILDTSTSPATPCVIAPGSLPGASPGTGVGANGYGSGNRAAGQGQYATDFPSDAIIMRPYGQNTVVTNAATGACANFQNNEYTTFQFQDGAIPSATNLMRFGLMTFDEDPSALIGVTNGANPTVIGPGATDSQTNAFGAFAGMWSYFPGWNSGGVCPYQAEPAGCSSPVPYAVGARNPAAPPWEGRMITFPTTNDIATQQSNNQSVVNVVLGSRPYGGTPLAGMMMDAEYYLWKDPSGPEQSDPLVHCGQRPQYIIVLTDGAPNLDMRGANGNCDGAQGPGVCPFANLPEQTALELNTATGGNVHPVTTYVLGFAVSSYNDGSGLTQCSTLATGGNLAAICASATPSSPAYACCELQKIAVNGSKNNAVPTDAYFADTPGDLQRALSAILAQIASHATTRTTPAFSASSQSAFDDPTTPSTAAEVFLASFNPSPGLPWTGDVTRTRDQCNFSSGSYTVKPVFDPTAGDDFGVNLNSHAGPQRDFIAFLPDTKTTTPTIDATATIRPYVTAAVGDGIGLYSARTFTGTASTVIPNISPLAMQITQPQPYTSTTTHQPVKPGLSPTDYATMILDYTFGQQSFTNNPGDFPFVSRYNGALGDIYHAVPAVVGPPATPLQDPLYTGFTSLWQTRKQVVYAATNDGLLHAFWADETKVENNELWAMMPPAVLPAIPPTYPSSHSLLLDGSPIVKDVVWDRSLTTADPTVWHTMLVAGYGSANRGYYAVDVTNPDASHLPSGAVPTYTPSPGPPGPVFRWQLTTMPKGNFPYFASHGATPAITTLFFNPGDGGGAREIGVAILPGGSDPAPTAQAECKRAVKTSDSQPVGTYAYRANVRCWGSTNSPTDAVSGRSLAIVRLDTGEIMQVFMRQADLSPTYSGDTLLSRNRIRDTPLDSPMTGTPVVFPADVGATATKVFVSDADGTIWKFDLSNSDPGQWTGELFLDLYNTTVDINATSWNDGQSLQVSPTLALDPQGEVVLNAATGTTDTFDSNGIEFIYSVTEKIQGSTSPKLRAFVNWYLGSPLAPPPSTTFPPSPQATLAAPALLPGERVSGPMTVFNGVLYFATYAAAPAPPAGTVVTTCADAVARIWALDFVNPADANCSSSASTTCDRSIGGKPLLTLPPPQPANSLFANITPSATDATLTNVVIPGLAINETPACASGGTATTDNYVAGASHVTPTNLTSPSYSIMAQVGQTNPNGAGARTLNNLSVPKPISPTQIDSWAAVVE